jgi:hypothetical protein
MNPYAVALYAMLVALRLGGFIYCNPDNPAVVVDGGPLHMAVNVLNKVTYVYVIYWAGWVMLASMVARAR